eukprot:NODE_124_length_17341_cov_0.560028.p13 type:complete len:118 gc:universal NODE_124_length_17341_cov_0.560028:1158-1511(+)
MSFDPILTMLGIFLIDWALESFNSILLDRLSLDNFSKSIFNSLNLKEIKLLYSSYSSVPRFSLPDKSFKFAKIISRSENILAEKFEGKFRNFEPFKVKWSKIKNFKEQDTSCVSGIA